MVEHAGDREFGDVRARTDGKPSGDELVLRSQRQVRSWRPAAEDRPRPLEFDASGFPIAQRPSTFVQRVARLLAP